MSGSVDSPIQAVGIEVSAAASNTADAATSQLEGRLVDLTGLDLKGLFQSHNADSTRRSILAICSSIAYFLSTLVNVTIVRVVLTFFLVFVGVGFATLSSSRVSRKDELVLSIAIGSCTLIVVSSLGAATRWWQPETSVSILCFASAVFGLHGLTTTRTTNAPEKARTNTQEAT
jgi:hypothetical protein